MADTPRSLSYLLNSEFQDGQTIGSITPQFIRDFVVSAMLLQSSTQTTNYTAALSDGGTVVEVNSASAVNFTVPPNSSVAFPIGTVIEVCQLGAGAVTIVSGVGVTLRNPVSLVTAGQYTSLSLRQRAANEWVVA